MENNEFVMAGIQLLCHLIESKTGSNPSESGGFENEVFSIDPQDEDGAGIFMYYESQFGATWYKHLGRGFSCDEIRGRDFRDLMVKCLNSLGE